MGKWTALKERWKQALASLAVAVLAIIIANLIMKDDYAIIKSLPQVIVSLWPILRLILLFLITALLVWVAISEYKYRKRVRYLINDNDTILGFLVELDKQITDLRNKLLPLQKAEDARSFEKTHQEWFKRISKIAFEEQRKFEAQKKE